MKHKYITDFATWWK